jgi:bacteriocin-like protein
MKNFKKLSREELKNVMGGKGACKLVVANANGTYTTYSGTCVVPVSMEMDAMGHVWPVANGPAFCDTGDHVSHTLSSNGGQSRC